MLLLDAEAHRVVVVVVQRVYGGRGPLVVLLVAGAVGGVFVSSEERGGWGDGEVGRRTRMSLRGDARGGRISRRRRLCGLRWVSFDIIGGKNWGFEVRTSNT